MSFDERDCELWIEECDIQSNCDECCLNEKRFVRSLKKSGESDLIPMDLSDVMVFVES